MDKDWKITIIAIAVVAILLVGGFFSVKAYSGLDNNLTVVVSGSMQHSDKSQLGVIDTGDMVIMKNKDKGITTYAEGYASGYQTFGNYGDVIIYERPNQNPVIHRAICYIEILPNGHFSCPSLQKMLDNGLCRNISGGTTTSDFTSIEIQLPYWDSDGNKITEEERCWHKISSSNFSKSGYLTKGDANIDIDQPIISTTLIEKSRIKAVAGIEIPWVGAIKLYVKGETEHIQSNTPFCLAFFILDILAAIVLTTIVWEYIDRRKMKGS